MLSIFEGCLLMLIIVSRVRNKIKTHALHVARLMIASPCTHVVAKTVNRAIYLI